MAADLVADVATSDEQLDLFPSEKSIEPPAVFASIQTTGFVDAMAKGDAAWNETNPDAIVPDGVGADEVNTDEFNADEFNAVEVGSDAGAEHMGTTELILAVDLFNNPSVAFKTVERQSVLLAFDTAQLESLFGTSDSLLLQVEYDATEWSAPSIESLDATDDGTNATTSTTQLRIVSLANQTAEVSFEVQPADPLEEGSIASITIKFKSTGAGSEANAQPLTTEQLQLATTHHSTEFTTTIIGSNLDLVDDATRFSPIGSSTAESPFEAGDDAEVDFGSGSDKTWASEEASGTQPLNQSESTPLPESRRESVDRTGRPPRRTIDIRTQGQSTWSATAITRAPVTPESLATQSALASVYDTDHKSASEASRPMLDPKPARLQVATFLLSRTRRDGSAVVINVTKPVPKLEEPAKENSVSRIEPHRRVTLVVEGEVSVAPEQRLTKMSDQTDEVDNTVEMNEEETQAPPVPVYASIVDRVLGSPVSLVAILGLTVVARLSESDEIIG